MPFWIDLVAASLHPLRKPRDFRRRRHLHIAAVDGCDKFGRALGEDLLRALDRALADLEALGGVGAFGGRANWPIHFSILIRPMLQVRNPRRDHAALRLGEVTA
jgi:hypothetical protein